MSDRYAPPRNPCNVCKHFIAVEDGHCYMFREEPQERCHQFKLDEWQLLRDAARQLQEQSNG